MLRVTLLKSSFRYSDVILSDCVTFCSYVGVVVIYIYIYIYIYI